MKKSNQVFLASLLVALFLGCGSPGDKPQENTKENEPINPVGIKFNTETLKRLGSAGDNWCITWLKDDSQITSMCDGNWLDLDHPGGGFHNHLFRLIGGPDDFQREDIPNYPDLSGEEGSWFGYGIVAIDDIIYSAISKTPGTGWSGPFLGVKLLKSSDNGSSWSRVDRKGHELPLEALDEMRNVVNEAEMFSLEEYGLPHIEQEAYPFSMIDFVQEGQANAAARDGYIYIYGPEGAFAHKLALARVPKDKLEIRNEWEYFTNYDENQQPQWTGDITKRGYVYEYPDKSSKDHYFGWYSWLPSVVWNDGLGLYIMVNGGTYAGHGLTNSDEDYYDGWMHTETGSLGFWYSENPYGPWTEIFYDEYWIVDDDKNRTYQPKLSPKWISEDGKEMTLIWSDAMNNEEGHSHTVNYIWNQMKVTIELK